MPDGLKKKSMRSFPLRSMLIEAAGYELPSGYADIRIRLGYILSGSPGLQWLMILEGIVSYGYSTSLSSDALFPSLFSLYMKVSELDVALIPTKYFSPTEASSLVASAVSV